VISLASPTAAVVDPIALASTVISLGKSCSSLVLNLLFFRRPDLYISRKPSLRWMCSMLTCYSHNKSDCPEPPNASGGGGGGGRECHNCKQVGHISRECPEPKVMRCRNCDEEGHQSRECDKPKDWSRVKCRNCEQFGHGAGRCPNPAVAPADGGWGDMGCGNGDSGAAAGAWGDGGGDSGAAAPSNGDWADETTAAAKGDNWGDATTATSTGW
jgi:hypothetical protein